MATGLVQKENCLQNEMPLTWCHTQSKNIKIPFKWTIDNFKDYDTVLKSCIFPDNKDINQKFQISLHPSPAAQTIPQQYDPGYGVRRPIAAGEIFVTLSLDLTSTVEGEKVVARMEFFILNIKKERKFLQSYTHVFGGRYGPIKFASRNELLTEDNGCIPNGQLTLCCNINLQLETVTVSGARDMLQINATDPTLVQDLGALLQCDSCSDVVFSFKDENIHAHKIILSARSKVFAAMFEHEMEEKTNNTVEITDVEPTAFKTMLQYIYTGNVKDAKDITANLLASADKYSMQKLKAICEDVLSLNLNVENVASLLAVSDMHSAQKLKSGCVDFIKTHISEVAETDGWNKEVRKRPNLTVDLILPKKKC